MNPPDGAFPEKVIVPVAFVPPPTELGLMLRPARVAGLIVSVAVCVWPFRAAEIVTVVAVETADVLIVNVPVDCPAGTTAVERTVAAPLLLEIPTVDPLEPAWPVNVTVPVTVVPPPTEVGLTDTDSNPAGLTVRVAVLAPFPLPAETETFTALFTPVVFTEKVAVVAPPATVTVVGTVTAALLDDIGTTCPPTGAVFGNVIVAVELAPPVTEVGFKVRLLTFTDAE